MPGVGGPIDEGERQEKNLPAVFLAEQAHAELAALVIEEQQIARDDEERERPPHCRRGLQEVVRARYRFEQKRANGYDAGPKTEPEDCRRRFTPASEEALNRPRQSSSDPIVRSRAPQKEGLEKPSPETDDQQNPHGPPKQGLGVPLRGQIRHSHPPATKELFRTTNSLRPFARRLTTKPNSSRKIWKTAVIAVTPIYLERTGLPPSQRLAETSKRKIERHFLA
jgi:hypothetical protein